MLSAVIGIWFGLVSGGKSDRNYKVVKYLVGLIKKRRLGTDRVCVMNC